MKGENVNSVVEGKRVSDRIMGFRLEIKGLMLSVCLQGEKVVIGTDFSGDVGERNRGLIWKNRWKGVLLKG